MLIYNSCLAQRDASDLPPPPPPRRDAHLSSLRKDRKTHPDCVIPLTDSEASLLLHFCFSRHLSLKLCFCVFNRIGPTRVANWTFRQEPFSLCESHFADAWMSREILQVRTAQVNPGEKKRKKKQKSNRDKHWLPKVQMCVGTSKKKKYLCIFFLHCWHLPIVMHRLNKLKLASVQHSTQK